MFAALRIACRFLKNSKSQTMVIILGIAIAVSVQIFIGLLSKGLEITLLNKFVGNTPHITVNYTKGGIEDWKAKVGKIKNVSSEIVAAAPVVEQQSFIKISDIKEPARVRGFIAEDLNEIYGMKNKIYEGKIIENNGQALVGKELKERLDLKLGDKLDIVTIDKKSIELIISGFYDLGSAGLNRYWIFTDLKTAQDLIGFGDKVTSIEVEVTNPYDADTLSKKISTALLDKELKVENWKDDNKLLLSGIIGQKICTLIIQFFVLLAAVLSIISVLGITVTQKYKQIGILKAMGIRDGNAALIFLMQAFILGVLGTVSGIVFTMLYIKGFNMYIVTAEGKPVVDIMINYKFIIISAVIDLAAATTAAFLPAMKTYRLNPVEIIKSGN